MILGAHGLPGPGSADALEPAGPAPPWRVMAALAPASVTEPGTARWDRAEKKPESCNFPRPSGSSRGRTGEAGLEGPGRASPRGERPWVDGTQTRLVRWLG